MTSKWKKVAPVVGAASLLSFVLSPSAFAMSLPNAFTNPYNSSWQEGTITFNSPKTPGTYDTSGDFQVLNGDPLRWISQMSKNGDDHGQYVKEKTQFPDGTEGTSIMFNDADMGNKDNGFTLISTDMAQNDVPDWITTMQGNPEYVTKRMNDPKYGGTGTLLNLTSPSQYSVIYAPSIVQWSGGRVEDLGVRVRSDGQTGDRVIKVIPTPPPTAQVTTDKPTYAAGDKVTINLTVNDYSANEGWQPDTNGPIAQDFHAEHLSVVKPDGSTIDLPINSDGQTYPAATGDSFPYSNHPEDGALYPVPGGGSGDPNTPKTYNETATLDTTGWPEGTYTVKFTVADSVNRRASNGTNGTVTATFTIGQQQVLDYNFGSDYTDQYTPYQPAPMNRDLTLTLDPKSVPKDLKPAPNDEFQFFYKVDDNNWKPLQVPGESKMVFDKSGNLRNNILLSAATLSTITERTWGPNETHRIQIKVTAAPNDVLGYRFSSQDSGTNQPEALVTITFNAKPVQPPIYTHGPLDMNWGPGLPRQVNRISNFTAPVEISNNGDEPKTTTLKFTLEGKFSVKRIVCDDDSCWAEFPEFPLTEELVKTFTIPPHNVIRWNIKDGLTYYTHYIPGGTENFPLDHMSDLRLLERTEGVEWNMPLNSESPAPSFWDMLIDPDYLPYPNYAVHLTVTAMDPEDYLKPQIDAWVGVVGPKTVPPKHSVHIVQ